MITLKFKDTSIEVRQNEQGLYCLNDIYRASGEGKAKQVTNFTRQSHSSHLRSEKVRDGRRFLTYGCEQLVYEYAAWISEEFKDAVFACFKAVANGDTQSAQDIAASVVIPQKLLDEIEEKTKLLQSIIGEWDSKQTSPRGKNAYVIVWKHLVDKMCVGTCTNELQQSFDVASVKDYLIKSKNVSGLGAYLATIRLIYPMLKAGLDYYTIKDIVFYE